MDYTHEELYDSSRICTKCGDSMRIRVDEAHKRIEFVCVKSGCDVAKHRPKERATAKMQFCPECRHMMRSVEAPKQKLQAKCTRAGCNFVGIATSTLVHSQNHRKVVEDTAINWTDMILDQTLQREYGEPCVNPSCENDELMLFQLHSPNGVESFGICTLCKYHWNLH